MQGGSFLEVIAADGWLPVDRDISYWLSETSHTLYRATDTGWKSIAHSQNYRFYTISTQEYLFPGDVDPGSNALIVGRLEDMQRITLVDFDSVVIWSMGNSGGFNVNVAQTLPAGTRDALMLRTDTLRRVRNGVGNPPVALPSSLGPANATYQRLYDTSFVAWRIISPGDTLLHVRRHGFSGASLHDTILTFTSPLTSVNVRLNPRDSSVALLCGSSAGVRLSYLDRYLGLWRDPQANAIHDLHINAIADSVRNVSGLFRNDTLLLVWEDYRNGDGMSDIYGNYWVIPSGLTSDHTHQQQPDVDDPNEENPNDDDPDIPAVTGVGEIEIVSMAPNPTHDIVTVELRAPSATSARLALYDAMGRRVWHSGALEIEKGSSTVTLDVEGLGPGVYTLLAESHGLRTRQRLVVLH